MCCRSSKTFSKCLLIILGDKWKALQRAYERGQAKELHFLGHAQHRPCEGPVVLCWPATQLDGRLTVSWLALVWQMTCKSCLPTAGFRLAADFSSPECQQQASQGCVGLLHS